MTTQDQQRLDLLAARLRERLPQGGGPVGVAIVRAIAALDREHHDNEARDLREALTILADPSTPGEIDDEFVPTHLRDGLDAYLRTARPTGSFLEAVLEGDLSGAVRSGSSESLQHLTTVVRWLQRHAPASAWGTAEKRKAWCELPQGERDEIMKSSDLLN